MKGSGEVRSSIQAVVLMACLLASTLAGSPKSVASEAGVPAAPGYDPKHILVSFDSDVSNQDRARVHATAGGTVVNRLVSIGLDVVAIPEGLDAPGAVALYSNLPGVASADLNGFLTPLGAVKEKSRFPNDPLFEQQWALHNRGANSGQTVDTYDLKLVEDADIDAPEGWAHLDRISDRKKVRVVILDDGIDRDHPDLPATLAACAGATKHIGLVEEGDCQGFWSHGTNLAGIIAANTDNGTHVAGIAPDVELAIFKFYEVWPTHADYFAGLEWAADPNRGNADVINMSFVTPDCQPNPFEEQLLRNAYDRGIVLVAASGNLSTGCREPGVAATPLMPGQAPAYPSAYPFVISVGGTNGRGEVWLDHRGENNVGTACNETVDILAPAERIWLTVLKDSFNSPGDPETGLGSGTSFATPHVVAVAAEVLAVTDWPREERVELVRAALVGSATEVLPHPRRGSSDCAGLGQVNLLGALEEATNLAGVGKGVDRER